MDYKLEVVVLPVSDVDRAKRFYTEQLGFRMDADTQPTETMRVVHMTPPGSACSVVVGPNIIAPDTSPARAALQLVVTDLDAAHAELKGRGVGLSDIQVLDPRDGGKFAFFADPDGNEWALQEVKQYVGAPLD